MPEGFPQKIEILPIVDRVVSAGLWVGRLLTKHIEHLTPSDHFTKPLGRYDTFDLESEVNHQLGFDDMGNYHEDGL